MHKTTLLSRIFLENFHEIFIRQYSLLAKKSSDITVLPSINATDIDVISKSHFVETIDFERELKDIKQEEYDSILAPCKEDISHFAPNLRPTFNFAAYVNKSETLKKLVQLGVDLHRIEKKYKAPELILKLDFEKDVKPYLFFLRDVGIIADDFGAFITKNPFIFQEDLDDLKVRINYLESKRFENDMITRIVRKNPFWLNFRKTTLTFTRLNSIFSSTSRIDNRLGHFQKIFHLSGFEIRYLCTKQPKIITYNMNHLKMNTFTVKEELGFSDEEMKQLLLAVPKLWMMSQYSVSERFDYIHNKMGISHDQIVQMPRIFLARKLRIQQRHEFLLRLGRAQYDPAKENYVSLETLVEGTDAEFCSNVAKSSVQAYNVFLKTL